MSAITKIFRPELLRTHMCPVADGLEEMTRDQLTELNDPLPPLSQWRPYPAVWWHRNGRRMKIPSLSDARRALAIRADVWPTLGSDLDAFVERLPFTVEAESWYSLRALHRLSGIDLATSAPRWGIECSDEEPYGWINAVDPLAERAHIFDTRPGRDTWVTEEFVRRVKAAGLEGLRFVHSGYLVRDLADAQPRPEPKARTRQRPSDPKRARVEALSPAHAVQLEQARVWASSSALPLPATVVDSYLNALDSWACERHREWPRLDATTRARLVAALAATYGDLVCRELGWHWATLHPGDDGPCLAIANAGRACALRVERFAESQLAAEDRTLKLQFNMLRAGQWPRPPAEGVLVVVG